jgi:hypothetical protein
VTDGAEPARYRDLADAGPRKPLVAPSPALLEEVLTVPGPELRGALLNEVRRTLLRWGLYDASLTVRDLVHAWRVPASERAAFEQVERYCMFVGYPRSGHSLTGSLLDAHPDMVVAHELDALRLVVAGVGRERLYSLILRRDREFSRQGRRWEGYDYVVPGQWQGRFRRLRVIGDKKGGSSALRLGHRPDALRRLGEIVRVPVHLIHHVRNPFDNITTMSLRHGWPIDPTIQLYFSLCSTVQRVRSETEPARWIDIRHEDLVAAPREHLARLCRFLHVEHGEAYLDACAGLVLPSPSRSRQGVRWTADDVHRVEKSMRAYDFLQGYAFDDAG